MTGAQPSDTTQTGPAPAASPFPGVSRRSVWTASALLVAAALLLYGRTALGAYTWAFDDARFIVNNPEIFARRGPWEFLRDFLTEMKTTDPVSPTGIVRPLRTMAWALTAKFSGLDPRAFHGLSVAVFAASSVALLRLLLRLTGSLPASLVGALLWVVHPMQTECVAWVSSLGDLGMAACSFVALEAALRCRGEDRPATVAKVVSLVAATAALLFKETAVVLPALVLAVRAFDARRRGTAPGLRDALTVWPWALLVVVYWFGYRMQVQYGATTHVHTFVLGGSTEGTLATMSRGLAFVYPLEALLPVRPALDWYLPPVTSFADVGAAAGALLLVAAGFVATRGVCAGRTSAVLLVLFFAPLLPVANFPFLLGIPTAERFLHLPLLALAFGSALVVARFPRRGLAAAAVAGLAVVPITWTRTAVWRDDTTLWPATQAAHPSPRAEQYMAAELRKDGFAKLAAARRLGPSPVRDAAESEARAVLERALVHAERAIALWHQSESTTQSRSHVVVEPHVNAANLAFLLDRPDDAIRHAGIAITVGEDRFPQAWYNAANAWRRIGRGACAVDAAIRALDLGMATSDAERDEFARMLVQSAALCDPELETAVALRGLDRAAAVAPDPAAARRSRVLVEEQVRVRIAMRREAAANSPRERALLAVTLAASGTPAGLDEADRIRSELTEAGTWPSAADVHWIQARIETRPGGAAAAAKEYAALAATDRDAEFRAALAAESAYLWDAALLARFRRVAAWEPAGGDDPRPDYARRAAARLAAIPVIAAGGSLPPPIAR